MKKYIVCLVLLAACHSPMSLTSIAPRPVAETFTCAQEQVHKLNYVVMIADTATGQFLAKKVTKEIDGGQALSRTDHDVLTVSMVNPDSATHSMRVVASSDEDQTWLGKHRRLVTRTTKQARKDAGVVLSACTDVAP